MFVVLRPDCACLIKLAKTSEGFFSITFELWARTQTIKCSARLRVPRAQLQIACITWQTVFVLWQRFVGILFVCLWVSFCMLWFDAHSLVFFCFLVCVLIQTLQVCTSVPGYYRALACPQAFCHLQIAWLLKMQMREAGLVAPPGGNDVSQPNTELFLQ